MIHYTLLQIAFYWEGNDLEDERTITYDELHREVCKFANVLKKNGVKKVKIFFFKIFRHSSIEFCCCFFLQGDCVAVYMPMIPELIISMLACSRIGAVHSIVFGGYR